MLIERGKLGAILRAVRTHRDELQDAVADRAGVNRAKVSLIETGKNRGSTARVRDLIAAGWQVPRAAVDALVEGEASTGTAAAAFGVPEAVLLDALGTPAPRRRFVPAAVAS